MSLRSQVPWPRRKNSHIDSYLAKAALLPTVTYHNQMLYTQPNGQTNQGGQAGTQASPIFNYLQHF